MSKRINIIVIVGLMLISSQLPAEDRLKLDNTSIVGSQELPKVLYVVPWKESRIGTLAGVSENGAFKDSMTALDRDEFLRELKYFNVLNSLDTVSHK